MKNTTKNLIALGILAILLVSSHNVLAYNNEPAFRVIPLGDDLPVTSHYVANNAYNTNNHNTAPAFYSVNTSNGTASNNSSNNTVNNNSNQDQNQGPINGSLYPNGNDNTNSDLTALSLNGSGGFMPSSIWQWLLVVLLILAIIIIARMIGRKSNSHNAHPAH